MSALGRRGAHLDNELLSVALAALVLPSFLLAAYWVKRNGAER
jgi:hypothetical protein